MISVPKVLAGVTTAAILAAPVFGATPPSLTSEQIADARELLFHDSRVRQYEPSLHDVPVDRAGVKSLVQSIPLGHRAISGDPVFRGVPNELLHQTYCGARSIVIAIAGESASTITDDKKAILTVTQFSVSEVIKLGGALLPMSSLEVVRPGGEVVDLGERLSVRIDDAQDYVQGQSYLLILRGRLDGQPEVYVQWGAQPVRDGRLTSRWEKFDPGTTLVAIYSELNRVQSLAPCPRLP